MLISSPIEPPKRVVIVDDSRSLRAWLRVVLEQDSRLQVVGEAADAFEAREAIKTLNPDVITLDIEMPRMSGLEFLTRMMKLRPMPVVMVSAATQKGSEAAVTALSAGAVDCIVKPTGSIDATAARDIARRVYHAAKSRVQPAQHTVKTAAKSVPYPPGARYPIILIGASTGGIAALDSLLPALDADGPPVVVVQHIPDHFLRSFIQKLKRTLVQRVLVAHQGMKLAPGDIVFAPSQGQHTQVNRVNGQWYCQLCDDTENALHCPSVDALFGSAEGVGDSVIAALLTGLGRDGAAGMKLLHSAGATTFAQDRQTSVVYGMPRVACEMGGVTRQFSLDRMASAINAAVAAHPVMPGSATVR